ncbi:MAG: zf-HC2 domain-containing protein [Minicystis sp.]
MTCIGRRRLEGYALGQLDEDTRRAVRAHLDACGECAEEAALLAAERRLFAQRAALPVAAPPPFAAVMARARDGGEAATRGAHRARIASAIAAAAALVGIYVGGRGPDAPRDDGNAPAIVAEPHGETCEDPSVTARAVACAEDEFGACLMATPMTRPAASAPAEPTNAHEEESCSVTCEGVEPHGEEAFESKARGERAP